MSKVLKPFAFAADGTTVELLKVGDERDFGRSTDGLIAEGFIDGKSKPEAKKAEEVKPEAEKAEVKPEAEKTRHTEKSKTR